MKLIPRQYQQDLVDSAKLQNTLVVLPTGLGKTLIAMMLAQHRLSQYPDKKVVMLAPTKPLVEQHAKSFSEHLDDAANLSTVLTGRTAPKKRAQQFDQASFVFSTPQTLQNDLLTKRISLEDVCLLIVDEAHRAVGEYAYVYICSQYAKHAKAERILALTASPGSSDESILEVIHNTRAEKVEVKSSDDPEVKKYIQETKIQYLEVEFPAYLQAIRKPLQEIVRSRLAEVRQLGHINRVDLNRVQILMAQRELQATIREGHADQEIWRSMSLLAQVLKIQHALELVETQGASAVLSYLDQLDQQAVAGKSKAVKLLVSDTLFRHAKIKAQSLSEKEVEHPKLVKLLALVSLIEKKNPDAKVIIFNQYRDMAQSISKKLAGRSRLFVGQQKKGATGLSQKEQKEMLDGFRQGEFPILVATSVGEEGLDIPAVDVVIFYEPVPSGIRTIQRRGRTGRHKTGRVFVLMTKDTREVAYRWSAHSKEKQMYRNLKKIASSVHPRQEQKTLVETHDEVEILADSREKSSQVLKELQAMGVNLTLQSLDVGDYLLSKRVCVEFKTAKDFVDSLLDGRLLEQLSKMMVYQRPIVVVQGSNWYEQRNVHPNAIRGLLSVIAVSYGIPILVTQNEKDTAALLHTIARREAAGGISQPQNVKSTISSDQLTTVNVVASFPNVGPVLAPKLLDHFHSLYNIVTATQQDLQDVNGVGKKKAKQLYEFFRGEFSLSE